MNNNPALLARLQIWRNWISFDRLAPIREIWTMFINNCTECYTHGNKMTVNEQLLSFRGRCLFRMYIKSKPDKYGIKLITLNDAETSYLVFAVLYFVKQKINDLLENENEKLSDYFFRKATEPIHGTKQTMTYDNWFTSIPLIDRFVKEPYNLTITGTICKNKTEIPERIKLASKTVPSTGFCFSDNMVSLSHTLKKNKIVILALSYPKSTEIVGLW